MYISMKISDYIHVSTCVYYLCWTAANAAFLDGIPSVVATDAKTLVWVYGGFHKWEMIGLV